jgi:hypothetical protein
MISQDHELRSLDRLPQPFRDHARGGLIDFGQHHREFVAAKPEAILRAQLGPQLPTGYTLSSLGGLVEDHVEQPFDARERRGERNPREHDRRMPVGRVQREG